MESARLVRPDQPRIPDHVGGKDRGEPTFDAVRTHSGSPAARQTSVKGAARAAGKEKPAQVSPVEKVGCSSSTRAAAVLASAIRPRPPSDALHLITVTVEP